MRIRRKKKLEARGRVTENEIAFARIGEKRSPRAGNGASTLPLSLFDAGKLF